MWSSIKKRWYLILGIILVLGFVGYRIYAGSQPKGKPYTVKKEDLSEILSFSGQVDASEKMALRFQSSGRLTWVGVKEGQAVKKLQGLASLDREQIKRTLQKYLNDYGTERNDFEDANEENRDFEVSGTLTNEQKDAVKRTLQNAQHDLDNSVLDFEIQNLAYKDAFLYTPIEGIVTRVDVPAPGANITPASAEFEVVNPKSIFFSALADQTEVVRLAEGMKAQITLDAFPEEDLVGIISTVGFSPKVGETGTVYEIKLSMGTDNGDYRFRLGMTGDVEFLLSEKKDAIAVPAKYVKTENGEKQVMKMINGKVDGAKVKTGTNFDGMIEILEGLNEGELIYDQAN